MKLKSLRELVRAFDEVVASLDLELSGWVNIGVKRKGVDIDKRACLSWSLYSSSNRLKRRRNNATT